MSSLIKPLVPTGPSRAELKSIWLSPLVPPDILYGPSEKPIDIAIVSHERFKKYAKNQNCYCIWYTSNDKLETRIDAISIDPPPPTTLDSPNPPPEPPPNNKLDPDEELRKLVPEIYHDYLDVFSPIEVK